MDAIFVEHNGWHFADNTFKCIFLTENYQILIEISVKYVRKGPIDNESSLFKVMASTNDHPVYRRMY